MVQSISLLVLTLDLVLPSSGKNLSEVYKNTGALTPEKFSRSEDGSRVPPLSPLLWAWPARGEGEEESSRAPLEKETKQKRMSTKMRIIFDTPARGKKGQPRLSSSQRSADGFCVPREEFGHAI